MHDPFKLTTILTSEVKDDTITIKTMMDGIHEKYWADIINTKEKMIRNGLVGLGWATPETKKELLEALKLIARDAPTEEPEIYYGDNHGDSYANGGDMARFHLAQIARAAIAREEGEKP